MNERIKELKQQAMEQVYLDGLGGQYNELNPEKFADLIIRECIKTVHARYKGINGCEDMEILRCIDDLKRLTS